MADGRRCKDCVRDGITSGRHTPHPGPRCVTHHRLEVKRRKAVAHARSILVKYGLTVEEYGRIIEFQGGRCAICQRANGSSRRLSVDHDHASLLVRGCLCRPCNSLLGDARDDPAFFQRAIDYLTCPPAKALGIRAIARPDG